MTHIFQTSKHLPKNLPIRGAPYHIYVATEELADLEEYLYDVACLLSSNPGDNQKNVELLIKSIVDIFWLICLAGSKYNTSSIHIL